MQPQRTGLLDTRYYAKLKIYIYIIIMTGVYQGQAMLPLYRELHRIALIMPLLQEANTCVLLLLIRTNICEVFN